MRLTTARIRTLLASHPRLVASLLVFMTLLAVSGGAAAVEAGGFDGVTLGDVETTDFGSGDAGPTDP